MSTNIAPWKQAIQSAGKRFNEIVAQDHHSTVLWDKEKMYALQRMTENDRLQQCPPQSIMNAIVNVASVGLTLNPALGLAYLVPRDGACCLDISYRGLVQLAVDSGAIRYVRADLVYENDHFEWRGLDEKPIHTMNPFSKDRGDVVGVYCYVKTSDGDFLAGTMSVDDVNNIRSLSKAPNSPAWKNHWGEMAKKVLIKREQKLWPKAARENVSRAIEVLNEHEGLREENLGGGVTHFADVRRKSDVVAEGAVTLDGEYTEEDAGSEPQEVPGVPEGMPLTDPTHRIIEKKLKAHGLDDAALFKAFEVKGWNELMQSQANDIMDWITSEAVE